MAESDVTRAAFDAALATYRNAMDRPALSNAARDHVDASPLLADLLAAYITAQEAWEADPSSGNDQARISARNAMVPVRQATAILNGAFPDTGHIVTATSPGQP